MRLLQLAFCFILVFCQNQRQPFPLENGDILFIGETSTDLSKAITEVTQTELKTNYSHMGIVEKSGNEYWFIHAAPQNGSERIKLEDYLKEEKKHSKIIDVYRIKSEFPSDKELAIKRAKEMLGKPYNFTYSLTDTAYYCSDFVYHAFAEDSIFEMNPMTFKNPGEEEFNQGWVSYYQKLGVEIPEGELGCNPNGMAASEKLIKVGTL